MKKTIGKYAAAAILLLISFTSFSQNNDRNNSLVVTVYAIPDWVSDKGYWVVEANIHQPLQYTVRFYNNQEKLIGTKQITGTKMNMKKEKVKMQLKAMLESSWLVWNSKNTAASADLVAKP